VRQEGQNKATVDARGDHGAPVRHKATLLAPLVTHRKGEFRENLEALRTQGFARVVIDGKTHKLDELGPLGQEEEHTIHLVVDRVVVRAEVSRAASRERSSWASAKAKASCASSSKAARRASTAVARVLRRRFSRSLRPQSFSFIRRSHVPGVHRARKRDEVDPDR